MHLHIGAFGKIICLTNVFSAFIQISYNKMKSDLNSHVDNDSGNAYGQPAVFITNRLAKPASV